MKKNKLSLFQVVFRVYERLEGRVILSPPSHTMPGFYYYY